MLVLLFEGYSGSTRVINISIICLCHQAHMARYLNYQRKAMLDDFIPTNGSLYTGLTRSKIECSIRCESVTGIQSFFYVHNTNACECYGTSYATSDGLSSVPSAKYYEKQVLDCGDPPGVANATVTSGAIVQGSERSYTCNVGYSDITNSSMNVACQQDGTWTEVAFECVQDCDEPPIVGKAVVSPGAVMQGSERLYTCDAGYSDINTAPMTVTCQQGGTWTAVAFQCVQDCAEPSIVVNAAVSPGAIVQGSERSYTCNVGYSDINNASMTVTCQQDGTWTPVAFECAQESCPSNWFQIGPSCYFFPNDTAAATDVLTAIDFCHDLSGYLVQLETEDEANIVEVYLLNTYNLAEFWLGITDAGEEGTWRWMETNQTATFLFWMPGEPNGGTTSNYARHMGDGTWGDKLWNIIFQPMCEKSLVSL